jgi:hypothetical protein
MDWTYDNIKLERGQRVTAKNRSQILNNRLQPGKVVGSDNFIDA